MKTIQNGTTFTRHKMDSTTPEMGIGVEYNATTSSEGDELKYEVKNVDFGIIERPKQDLRLTKRVTNVKVTLANGLTLIDAEIDEEGNKTGKLTDFQYMKPNEYGNGFVRLEIDNEIIEGARLEIGYELKATNASELDYISSDYYLYGEINGDLVTITPSAVIDYLDNDWAFENDKNPDWTVQTREELEQKGGYTASDGTTIVIDNAVYNTDVTPDTDIENRIILYTEALATKLDPLTNTNITVPLNVSKILTSAEDISLDNETEVIKVEKTGGSDIQSTPGNYIPGTWTPQTEKDTAMAETTTVTGPTGENKNYIMITTIGISALVILALGVFIIKKKVINNNDNKKDQKTTND